MQQNTSQLQNIFQTEYFGLNPNKDYNWIISLQRKYGSLGEAISAIYAGINGDLRMVSPVFYAEHYKKIAKKLSVKRNWQDTRLFSISELNGSSELEDYLRETAAHVMVSGVPGSQKIVSPTGGEFITGGVVPRIIKLNLNFYAKDEKGKRAYFGLPPELSDSWLHILSAADHNETIHVGTQLTRAYDLTKNLYVAKYVAFPSEQVDFGDRSYSIVERGTVERGTLEELAKSHQIKGIFPRIKGLPIRRVTRDRIFRAIAELGYVY